MHYVSLFIAFHIALARDLYWSCRAFPLANFAIHAINIICLIAFPRYRIFWVYWVCVFYTLFLIGYVFFPHVRASARARLDLLKTYVYLTH